MWDVQNHSPFPASGGFLRDVAGRSLWSIWIAADFKVRNERPPLFVADQMPPQGAPLYINDDPDGMILCDIETGLARNGVDVTIAADAYPDSVTEVTVARAAWGNWAKPIAIHPPKVWGRRGQPKLVEPDAPAPVALDWRHAAQTEENPLGVPSGFARRQDAQDRPLPRLMAEGAMPRYDVQSSPVSFMPIPRSWPQRAALGGTYDTAWQRSRAPLLPADVDPRYWQAAPSDQVLSRTDVTRLITDGTPLTFDGMLAGGRFTTIVPDLTFEIAVNFKRAWHDLACALQSLHVDLRTMTMRMIWQADLPIQAAHFDVEVDRTYIALLRARGMVVNAAEATRFAPSSLSEAVSA